jgi:titin
VTYSTDGVLFTTFPDGTSTATNTTITGLTNGTAYTVRIAAVIAAGNGPTVSTTGTPRTVPGAPTALSATPGNAKLTLTWTAPASNGGAAITDYIVNYSVNGGPPITFGDGVKPTTGAVITGLVNGTTYTITVAAVNLAGTGPAVSSTAKPRTVPGAPTALAATPYHSTVALTWAAPTSTGGSPITDYVVQYRRTTSSTWLTFNDGVSTTRSAKVTGLVDRVSYAFRVAAKNVAGTGAVSAAVTATPTAVPGPVTVTATPGTRRVTLAWTAPPAGATAVTDYVVQYRRSSSATWLTFNDGVSTTRSAAVTGLTAGLPYSFRVAARNRTGAGPWSATVGATPR